MNTQSELCIQGAVTIKCFEEQENCRVYVGVMDKLNMVVRTGRIVILNLLKPGTLQNPLTGIRFGNGGSTSTTLDTSSLVNEVVTFSLQESLSGSASDTLTFIQTVMSSSFTTTTTLSEAGIFCQDGTLFARVTFPAITLNPSQKTGFELEWKFSFNI